MRFLHVDPTAKTVTPVESDAHPQAAVPALAKVNVDHGVVFKNRERGIGVFVYEYGLMEGAGPYFELGGQLYSGDAVLYAFDAPGDTIDMPQAEDYLIAPRWLPTKEDVELAIAAGVVQRPVNRVNGVPVWSWS
jgi:hypothetical protein